MAEVYEAKHVSASCLKYFEQNFETAIKSEGFPNLDKQLFLQSLKSENLVVSTPDIINEAILIWGKAHTHRNNSDSTTPSQAISKQELFYHFFPVLRQKRKWSPSNCVADIKQSVLEVITSTKRTGIRVSQIFDRLKPKFSYDDVRNCVNLLVTDGNVCTNDGENFVIVSPSNRLIARKRSFCGSLPSSPSTSSRVNANSNSNPVPVSAPESTLNTFTITMTPEDSQVCKRRKFNQ